MGVVRDDRPTVPAGASLQEAKRSYLAESGIQGGPAQDVYRALAYGEPLTDAGRELLRARAALPTLQGAWASTVQDYLGIRRPS